jgi:hypothetical protein
VTLLTVTPVVNGIAESTSDGRTPSFSQRDSLELSCSPAA